MKRTLRIVVAGLLAVGLSAGWALAAEESAETLQKAVSEIVQAAKAGEKDKVEKLCGDLVLPDPAKWFTEVFGEAAGKKLAEEYAALPKPEIAKMFLKAAEAGRTEVRILKIEKADDKNATGLQQDAIKAMTKPVALYTAKLVEPGKEAGLSVWSFVWADGAFRLAGKMKAIK